MKVRKTNIKIKSIQYKCKSRMRDLHDKLEIIKGTYEMSLEFSKELPKRFICKATKTIEECECLLGVKLRKSIIQPAHANS